MMFRQKIFGVRRAGVAALMLSAMAVTMTMSGPSAHAQNSAQEAEDRRRSRQTLSPRTGTALNEALNFANEDPPRIPEAIEAINRVLSRDNLPPYDRATSLEVRGQLYTASDRLDLALRDYEQVLALDVLPSNRTSQIRRNVAQLYYVTDQFRRAINFMEGYIREAGAEAEPNDFFIVAASYVQLDDYRGARGPAERAVQLDTDRKKQFYDLLNLVYNELNLDTLRGRLLETMVEYFPSEESYWEQLAASYSAAGRNADALAALEVAYAAGLISDEDKIVTLAQFYYDQNNPYRGAVLLESEMNAGNVDRDLQNLELLGQLWAAAREQDKSIAILTEAAPKRDDGRLYYQLGQSYLADEQYSRAISNLRSAVRRGGLPERDIGNARVLIGTALFQQDSESKEARTEARDEFVLAAEVSSSARVANSWIEYIDTIESTLEQQAAVELSQAIERQTRQIERCGSIIDVIELGGRTDVPEDEIASCRALLARVDAGETAKSMVEEERAAAEAEENGESEEEAG
ncbi:MAG: hypothetical protein AAF225_09865 [Pseudomonadota bacterium]